MDENVFKRGFMKKIFVVVAIVFFIMPSYASADISLGSLSDTTNIAYSYPDGVVQLKYSFFNKGDENLNLKVSYETLNDGTRYDLVESDKRIYLMYEPYPTAMMGSLSLILPPTTQSPVSSPEKEWIALDSGRTYAEIRSAYLYVRIPISDIHSNPYKIKLVATTMPMSDPQYESMPNATSTQIVQQREYLITIYNDARKVDLVPDTIDSDGDGLTDKDEENVYRTNPFKKDTDSDGINDGDEVARGTDPNDAGSPGGTTSTLGSIFDSLGALIGLSNNVDVSEGSGEGNEYMSDDAENRDTAHYNPGESSESGEIDETTEGNSNAIGDEKTGPTGQALNIPQSRPVNIATVIIIIIGILFIYRLSKTRV